jgi:hypothetical protein
VEVSPESLIDRRAHRWRFYTRRREVVRYLAAFSGAGRTMLSRRHRRPLWCGVAADTTGGVSSRTPQLGAVEHARDYHRQRVELVRRSTGRIAGAQFVR